MAQRNDLTNWDDDDTYWRTNFRQRPYASSGTYDYDYYRPAYRYGFDAAHRYHDRDWTDAEADISRGWEAYEHRGTSTWEQVKDAVRDAWDRVTGKRMAGTRR
jgi:hypothetical protein